VETNRNAVGGGQAVVHKYEYDQCFPQSSSQEAVYEEAKDLLQSCLDGFNVCLFAYGQTGSGKTHTMLGSPGSDGVIPRFINDLYHWSEVCDCPSENTKRRK
jgi:kinesin family protein C1